mgnify:CR=1 FL=1
MTKDDYARWWMVYIVYILVLINLVLTLGILIVLGNHPT